MNFSQVCMHACSLIPFIQNHTLHTSFIQPGQWFRLIRLFLQNPASRSGPRRSAGARSRAPPRARTCAILTLSLGGGLSPKSRAPTVPRNSSGFLCGSSVWRTSGHIDASCYWPNGSFKNMLLSVRVTVIVPRNKDLDMLWMSACCALWCCEMRINIYWLLLRQKSLWRRLPHFGGSVRLVC